MNFTETLRSHEDDTHVFFAGDWHGDASWGRKAIIHAANSGVSLILHVGDFGVWGDGGAKKYIRSLEACASANNVDIWVTGGNHENWDYIYAKWDNPKRCDEDGSPLPFQLSNHIWFFPRPYRFNLGGKRFLSMGGGASVDFPWRTEGRSWWPREAITDEEVAAASVSEADVLIVHESPDIEYATHPVQKILATNPIGFPQEALTYSAASRRQVSRVVDAVRPELLIHGHMHVFGARSVAFDEDRVLSVISLDCEYSKVNLFNVEISTLLGNPEPIPYN